jgi:hypothetical protein
MKAPKGAFPMKEGIVVSSHLGSLNVVDDWAGSCGVPNEDGNTGSNPSS